MQIQPSTSILVKASYISNKVPLRCFLIQSYHQPLKYTVTIVSGTDTQKNKSKSMFAEKALKENKINKFTSFFKVKIKEIKTNLLRFCAFATFSLTSLLLKITLPIPSISGSCVKIKIHLNFFFILLYGASKGFMKTLKTFLKVSVIEIYLKYVKYIKCNILNKCLIGSLIWL